MIGFDEGKRFAASWPYMRFPLTRVGGWVIESIKCETIFRLRHHPPVDNQKPFKNLWSWETLAHDQQTFLIDNFGAAFDSRWFMVGLVLASMCVGPTRQPDLVSSSIAITRSTILLVPGEYPRPGQAVTILEAVVDTGYGVTAEVLEQERSSSRVCLAKRYGSGRPRRHWSGWCVRSRH